MAKKKQSLSPIKDDVPELVVDKNFKSPPPLDPRIAAVQLRTPTNNPTEGYDLLVSAAFGEERITLKADDLEVEVTLSITSADIELECLHCSHSLADGALPSRGAASSAVITEKIKTHSNISASGKITVNPLAAIKTVVGVGGDYSHTHDSTTERTISKQDWHPLTSYIVKIDRSGSKLDGLVLDDQKIWKIHPDAPDQPSWVLARLKVRADWLKFRDAEYVNQPSSMRTKLADLLKPGSEKRKELFELLLKHLACTELARLQGDPPSKEATIAAQFLVVRPRDGGAVVPSPPKKLSGITIPLEPIKQFLNSDRGHEESALIALGVRADLIPKSKKQGASKIKRREIFIPEGSPEKSLHFLEQHFGRNPSSRHGEVVILSSAVIRAHRNTLRDLKRLGIIGTRPGDITAAERIEVWLSRRVHVSPSILLKHAVAQAPGISITRTVLRINQEASGREIGDAVAAELGLKWPTIATRQRKGGALKRWLVWLEPHVIDPAAGAFAAGMVTHAATGGVSHGMSSALRDSLKDRFKDLVEAGLTQKQIGEELNITIHTVRNWMKKLNLRSK